MSHDHSQSEDLVSACRYPKLLPNLSLGAIGVLSVTLLLLAHIKLPNDGGHGLYLPFNTICWVALIVIIALGAFKIANERKLVTSGLTNQLSISALLLSIPILYLNVQLDEPAYRIFGIWVSLLFFAALQQFQLNTRAIYSILVLVLISVWIEAGRYWYLMMVEFLNSGLFPTNEESKLYGVFQQRNVMSSFVATGLVISGFLLAEKEKLDGNRWVVVLLILSPLVLGQVLHTMSSRAGWLGATIGIACIAPLMLQKTGFRLSLLWFAALVIGLNAYLLLEVTGDWAPSAKSIVSMAGERMSLYPQSIQLFLENWLWGIGYGGFEFGYISFVAEKYASGEFISPSIPNTFHPHNEFLFWGIEGGIVPVVGLLVAAWAVWSRVLRLNLIYRLAIVGLFFPITLHSQVEYPFYHSVIHLLVFILFILLVDALMSDSSETKIPRIALLPLKIGIVAVSVISIIFLLTTLYSGLLLTRFNDRLAPMSSLRSINNPVVWRDKIDYAISSNLLFRALSTGETELARPYISWGEDIIKREPRPLFYEYLILAYQNVGDLDSAQATLEEFEYFFPETKLTEIAIER